MEVILARCAGPTRQALLTQFLRFGVVGTLGFGVDTATVYATKAWLGLYGAGIAAYLVAASFNWILNRVWTFRGQSSGRMHRQWLAFLGANLIGFVVNRGLYSLLVTVSALCAAYPVLAVACGSVAGLFFNFTLSRRMVFR
jgi:putative flippase GtrA